MHFVKHKFLYTLDLTPIMPVHWSLRYDYHEFKAKLDYSVKLCLKKKKGVQRSGFKGVRREPNDPQPT